MQGAAQNRAPYLRHLWAALYGKRNSRLIFLLGIVFSIWVIFFGGAERLENTILGFFEFGIAGEKSIYIKVVAWIGLIGSVALFLSEITA